MGCWVEELEVGEEEERALSSARAKTPLRCHNNLDDDDDEEPPPFSLNGYGDGGTERRCGGGVERSDWKDGERWWVPIGRKVDIGEEGIGSVEEGGGDGGGGWLWVVSLSESLPWLQHIFCFVDLFQVACLLSILECGICL